MINGVPFLRYLLASTLLGLTMGPALYLAGHKRRPWHTLLLMTAITALSMLLIAILLPPDSPVKLIILSGTILLQYTFLMRLRGRELIIRFFVGLLLAFLADIAAGSVLIALFSSEEIIAMRSLTSPLTYLMQLASGGTLLLLALLWRGLCALIASDEARQQSRKLLIPLLTTAGFLLLIIVLMSTRDSGPLPIQTAGTGLVHLVPASLILGTLMGLALYIIAKEQFDLRHLLSVQLTTSLYVVFISSFLNPDSPFKFLFTCIFIVMLNAFLFRLRGRQLIIRAFEALLVSFIGDIVGGIVGVSFFTSEQIVEMRFVLGPLTYLLQLLSGGSILISAVVWHVIRSVIVNSSVRQRIGYLIRPLLMLGVTCALFAKALLTMPDADQLTRLKYLLPDFVMIVLLLICCVTYAAQDIRHYQQLLQNQRLLHQQSLQELLFQDMRLFRHNISNMLYGLQGMMLGDDVQALRAYYQRMVENCQIINNENVVALRRIPSVPVSALLLNKVQQANGCDIPFFVTVEERIAWGGLGDDKMTQVVGALVDNAIEAAMASDAPYVAFEAGNKDGMLVLTVRNTYSGEPPVFTDSIISSKEGHEGLGLKSVRRIVRHTRSGVFNIYTRGRYVEASVMIRCN